MHLSYHKLTKQRTKVGLRKGAEVVGCAEWNGDFVIFVMQQDTVDGIEWRTFEIHPNEASFDARNFRKYIGAVLSKDEDGKMCAHIIEVQR